MIKLNEEINEILDIGYAISTEPYYKKLFELTVNACGKFTGADAGQFYIAHSTHLQYMAGFNRTLDGNNIKYSIPETSIDLNAHDMITYTAAHREILRIDDIYLEKRFEILKLKEFDAIYNYRTCSMMMIPVLNQDNKVLGVMVLTNCTDDTGKIIPFSEDYEKLCSSLTSQMAIAITNMNQLQEMDDLLKSFVECVVLAIDERTPYNGKHSRNVAKYCDQIITEINTRHTYGQFRYFISPEDRDQLIMAANLHDIGKMVTPREVLNKATRLGNRYEQVRYKLEKISLMMKIDKLEGRMDPVEWAMADLRLSNFLAELEGLNVRSRLTDSEIERVNDMAKRSYTTIEGQVIHYLDEDERKALSIAKGTLTDEERKIVMQHVEFTEKLLREINFTKKYDRVKEIASNHHEFLDGSGYPNHYTAEKIDVLTRILTIIDIYDSLTADDRPYKGTISVHEAVKILDSMADEGKLDKELERLVHEVMWKQEYGESRILG